MYKILWHGIELRTFNELDECTTAANWFRRFLIEIVVTTKEMNNDTKDTTEV